MAHDKAEDAKENLNNYASRHPRRMWSSMFLMGTALGATIMAAKKNHDKNAFQRFMDQIGH
jgi:hypothetical protein